MKTLIKGLLTLSVIGIGLTATTTLAQDAAPKIACDAPTFDFGQKDNSTVVEHDFVIRNDGDVTLVIDKAKPSCGCTVANVSPRDVPPGETSTITAKLNLHGRTGKQHKTISVTSNDPNAKSFVLTLTGTATSLVDVQPRNIHASNLKPGQIVTNVVTLTSREEEPIEILDVNGGNPLVTTEVREVEPGRTYEIVVTTTGDLPKGPTFGRVAIRTNSKRMPMANIAYRYNVVGEISIYPQELAMIEQTKPYTKTLVVTPGTVTDFEVTKVEVPNPDIGVNVSPLGGGRYRILLSNIIPSMDLNGQKVRVLTTAPNMETVEIPFKVIRRR